ncbi:MAG: MATE family efflux transporter [Deltaproteobacteria bacterium]|nr:MATE family efflux transporter [Deltaproteobacteria bacterium]
MEKKPAKAENPGPGGPPTRGVATLLGDPKKAIVKLAIPMIVANLSHTIYNLTDAIWVSGKGPEALSAVGFFFPFHFMAMALAGGVGIGAGAAISRQIGAKNKEGADNIAAHTIVIMLALVIPLTFLMLILTEPILKGMGATGDSLALSVSYARIMFSGLILIFFTNIANSILRSEGDARRAMYAMLAGAILNIILDPIFIYTLGLGVVGAAWATIVSMFTVSLVVFYWLFIKKDTYVTFKFKGFRFIKWVLADIAKVGVPASISQMSMSIMSFSITTIVARVGGPDGVAVYITGWRVVSLATLPMMGLARAVTPVTAAAFGAKDYRKMETSYLFAIKLGVMIETGIALVTLLFASPITWIFTWSGESARLADDLVLFLRMIWVFYPGVAFGMLSGAMFQGAGKGLNALIMTLIRTLVFNVPFAWFFGVYLDRGLKGVWIGMILASLAYIPIAFGWAYSYLQRLKNRAGLESSTAGDLTENRTVA